MRDGSFAESRCRDGHLKRRIFNVATAMSLLLCAVVVAFWVSSLTALDYITKTPAMGRTTYNSYTISTHDGDFDFHFNHVVFAAADSAAFAEWAKKYLSAGALLHRPSWHSPAAEYSAAAVRLSIPTCF